MTSNGDVSLRTVIQFGLLLDKAPKQTKKELKEVGKHKFSRYLVFRWEKKFHDGRQSVENERRNGRQVVKRLLLLQENKNSMDMHGMILIHCVPEGQTMNIAYYSKINIFLINFIYEIVSNIIYFRNKTWRKSRVD